MKKLISYSSMIHDDVARGNDLVTQDAWDLSVNDPPLYRNPESLCIEFKTPSVQHSSLQGPMPPVVISGGCLLK